MKSVLYVSESKIGYSYAENELSKIVEHSRWFNDAASITGALILTEKHFVQFIEGPPATIDALLENINADSRHENIVIIESAESNHRYFETWNLAYSGPDDYIDRKLILDLQRGEGVADAITAADLRSSMLRMASQN